jgi:hypothetical protein
MLDLDGKGQFWTLHHDKYGDNTKGSESYCSSEA